jgi:ATP-binding cassette subfamily F protein 3
MDPELILRLDELEKRIGGRLLFGRASAVVRARDRIGVVGPNGAGKTTLLHVLNGDDTHDGGTLHRVRDARTGLLRQEIDPRATHSVRQEAQTVFAELDELEAELRRLETEMGRSRDDADGLSPALASRYDEISHRFAALGGFERDARVGEILAGLGFDADDIDRPLSSFSGGWLMRVELAKLLLARPEILLLDEPTNHLDLPSIQFFEETLESYPGAVLVVSHDRTFLRRQTNRIIELDGRGGFQLYEGGYDRFLEQRDQRRAELLARKANQDRQIAEKERFIARFGAKASKARQAQSRAKALEKIERIEVEPERGRSIRLRIPPPARSGDRVLALRDLHKRYGPEIVYDGVDFELRRGEKVALAGPNGAGKSTLLRIAAGAIELDAGERELGHNVTLAYFAQHQLESLDPDATVLEELARDAQMEDVPRLRSHLGALLFAGDEVDKKISVLSGGEKARVAFAKLLLRPANLLILDEPTNHLDIEACEVLEAAFQAYEGTLLFVSHDRSFINALATRVVEVASGRLESHLGNYDAYLERRATVDGSGAPQSTDRSATPTSTSAGSRSSIESPPADEKAARQQLRERRKARDRAARTIERLEARISEEEAHKEAHARQLAEPEAYLDPARSAALQSEQEDLAMRLDALYREWEQASEEFAALEADLSS